MTKTWQPQKPEFQLYSSILPWEFLIRHTKSKLDLLQNNLVANISLWYHDFFFFFRYLYLQVIGGESEMVTHTNVRTRPATWIIIKTWNWRESSRVLPCQKGLSSWKALRHIKEDLHVQSDRSILQVSLLKRDALGLWFCMASALQTPLRSNIFAHHRIFFHSLISLFPHHLYPNTEELRWKPSSAVP